ncbi:hypothetical protein FOCC_FOCC009409 [Frankliniella occidentalis]|uniref:Uncharacterized protein LOC113217913 n=1 Tax=Frankliniella occidentalis TaxID=133901 RepID=A0A6J1TKE5_FRAOC|nr:uncharacterized protein LOC113217913 [Frankliniella occidentalis]KAE8743946.1 hypothetical protein FOCC_FOCC009409 [Frankliniella occidentalis]
MSYKVVFVLAALCLAQVIARPEAAEPVKFDEIVAKTQNAINTMAVEVQKALGVKELPEPQKVADSIIQGGKDLAKQISDIVTEISSKPDLNSAVSAITKRINTTVEDLQKQVPTVQAKASELQKTLQTSMQTLVTETQKLAENLGPVQADMKKSLESVMDQVSKAAVEVQKKVKEAIDAPVANV